MHWRALRDFLASWLKDGKSPPTAQRGRALTRGRIAFGESVGAGKAHALDQAAVSRTVYRRVRRAHASLVRRER